MSSDHKGESNDFLEQASHGRQQGLVGEFLSFMKENKAWWLTPILLVLALVGALILLAGTGVAPFIYTLF